MVVGGACVVAGGWGRAWLLGGGGHAWLAGGVHRIRRDTVNERAVRILLECILVLYHTRLLPALSHDSAFISGVCWAVRWAVII